MRRPHVVDQLSLYADGMLPADEAERVRAHLAGCEECRAEWEALQQTLALLRSLPGEEPPEDLVESIMARIRAEAGAPPARHRMGKGARWGMAAAAAVLLLLAAGMLAERLGHPDLYMAGGAPEQAVQRDAAGDAAEGLPTVSVTSTPAPSLAGDAGPGIQGRLAAEGAPPAEGAGGEARDPKQPAIAQQEAGTGVDPAAQRRVIQSATIFMRVEDVEGTYHQVIAMAEAAGGYAQEASLSSDGIVIPPVPRAEPAEAAPPRSAYLVLRVPAERLSRFTSDVMALAAPGTRPDLHTSATDITTEYVDVEARMRTLQAKEARLLEILDQAQGVEDLLAVEREVWQTRSEIESLQARLDTWNRLLDLATLNLTLQDAGVRPPERDHGLGQRLLLALYQALDYLVVSIETMIVGAGVVLPWAVLAIIAWLALARWRRRRAAP
ncbi:MAG: DUF4349 domain-containing protein [Thermaerobacter sp.]